MFMMASSIFRKKHPHAGASPGTLAITEDSPPPKIHVIHYAPDSVDEADVTDVEQLHQAHQPETITWVDVQGYGDETMIRRIAEIFSLHPLAIEDVVNIPQRPKSEMYDKQMLIIVRMVQVGENFHIDAEQVSIVLGETYVLTFQEKYGDVLEPVRKRIRSGKGPMRREKADYLAYALFDTIVDGYYPALEEIGNELEAIEEEVVENPTPELLRKLNSVRNKLTNLRRAIWPQREAANRLVRDETPLIRPHVRVYLRDTYDHCVQSSEVVEMYREMATGMISTYLSSIANRSNEVMKVLTIMASIFIPLTFLAGIYGMNFDHMPELHMRWAYPLVWITMFAVAIAMVLFFVRKGWIGNPKR
tara:strand:+ start:129284 stop:130366 length:1083 start_codon:yes stop_codon:yes gene_type:complete